MVVHDKKWSEPLSSGDVRTFHGIMHQKKFGGCPMSGKWRRHPPPLSKVVVVVQILFLGHFDLKIGPLGLRKKTENP